MGVMPVPRESADMVAYGSGGAWIAQGLFSRAVILSGQGGPDGWPSSMPAASRSNRARSRSNPHCRRAFSLVRKNASQDGDGAAVGWLP